MTTGKDEIMRREALRKGDHASLSLRTLAVSVLAVIVAWLVVVESPIKFRTGTHKWAKFEGQYALNTDLRKMYALTPPALSLLRKV